MTIRRERHLDITINVAVHPPAATDTGAYDAIIGKLHGELDQLAGSVLAGRMDHRLRLNTDDSNPTAPVRGHLRGPAFIDP
jgi:hypothetical protein